MKRLLSIGLVLALVCGLAITAAAASAKGTTVRLGSISGSVTVKNAGGGSLRASSGTRLYNGYSVSTGRGSSAFINLDSTKAVKLAASSSVKVKKSGSQLEVTLLSGNLYFNVTQPLSSSQKLNIRTSTTVTGIRGSSGWINADEVCLLHGHVTVYCFDRGTERAEPVEVFELVSGQGVDVSQLLTGRDVDHDEFNLFTVDNDRVPAFVVEEIRNDADLQAELTADVPSIDVPALLNSYAEKQAEERQSEAETQAALDEALARQQAEIAADPVDYYFDDESGGVVVAPSAYFTVTMPAAGVNYSAAYVSGGTTSDGGLTYTVNSGGDFTLTYSGDADHVLGPNFATDISGASVTGGSGSYTVTFPVLGDTDLNKASIDGVYQTVTTLTGTVNDNVAVNGAVTAGNAELNGNLYVTPTGSLEVPAGSTVTNNATVYNDGTITVNGTFQNYSADTLVNSNTLNGTGTFNNGDGSAANKGSLVNESGATVQVNTVFNYAYSTITNEGAFNIDQELRNYGSFQNSAGGSVTSVGTGYFRNNGSIQNEGSMTADSLENGTTYYSTGAGAVTNNGTMSLSAGTTMRNEADGTLTNNGSFTLNGTLDNRGTIHANAAFTGSGTIENASVGTITGDTGITPGTYTAYVVTFDAQGGTVSPPSLTYSFSDYVAWYGLPTPTWEGHTFDCWHEGSPSGTAWGSGKKTGAYLTENITLYAGWE